MINFTAWPEMLAWPYLMLQGWLPYRDIAIAHSPLLLVDLVIFFKIFGVGILQLKIYTWVLIACNVLLTYFVSNKFFSKKAAIVSSIFYLVLCFVYQGNGLWFDLALTPFALLLYLFLRSKNYLWVGIIFALGFITKQTFIYFSIPVIFYILRSNSLKKDILYFVSGIFLIFTVFAIVMARLGILDDYYKWAIEFGIFYLPKIEGQVQLPNLKQLLFAIAPFLVLFFKLDILVLLFATVGAMGVYPRWELFHFQPALPFVAIAISNFLFSGKKNLFKIIVLAIFSWHLFIGVDRILGSETRFYEPQVRNIVSEIRKKKSKDVYIVNYWDNLYALSVTQPVTKPLIPYIPWYLNYKNTKSDILNDLRIKTPQSIVIGERDTTFPEIYVFIDKYYTCGIFEGKIEFCEKN